MVVGSFLDGGFTRADLLPEPLKCLFVEHVVLKNVEKKSFFLIKTIVTYYCGKVLLDFRYHWQHNVNKYELIILFLRVF